ncbi:hypothetical protein BH23CHL4_BH23CHL4_11380 [soil metagenome]
MNKSGQSTPLQPSSSATAALLERIGRLPYIGRQTQLQVIEQAVQSACAGEGRVIFLSGEAGIGKSRLLNEARRMAEAAGGAALAGECVVEPGAPPYYVWIKALRGLDDQTAHHLLEGSGQQESTIPYNTWRSRRLSADEARFRLFSDFMGAFERSSRRQPLLVALDDLQWSDPSSLQLLQFVAHHVAETPVIVLGAMRSEDLAPTSPLHLLIDELEGNHRVSRLHLPPFTFAETQSVVAELLGSRSGEMARLLDQHCEGNPFVLEETVRSIVSSHGFVLKTALGRDALPLPTSVRASIRVRLDRLPSEERDALEAAAIAGKVFEIATVANALGMNERAASALLERLATIAMLRPGPTDLLPAGAYEFLHDRVREVVLHSLSPAKRKSLHLRVARALEMDPRTGSEPNTVAALANHYRQAGDFLEAAWYFSQLGDLSLQRHAPDEAAAAFDSAIDMQRRWRAGPVVIGDLEMKLGNALLVSGKKAAVEAFARAAQVFRDAGALRAAGAATGRQGLALAYAEQHNLALANYQNALNLLGSAEDSNRERASVLLHMSETLGPSLARYEDALNAQRQAIALLDPGEAGDPLRSLASLALGRNLMRMNRLADAQEVLEQALPATIRLGELGIAADLHGARANAAYWKGDVRQSRICTLQRQATATAAGDGFNMRHVSSWLAHLEVALGNWAEAERLLQEADRDVLAIDSPEPVAFTRQIRGHLAFMRGDYVAARELMLESLTAFRKMGAATLLWYIGYNARASFAANDGATGEYLAQEAWLLLDELPPNALPRAATLTQLALLAVENGQVDHVRMMYDALLPFAGELHWNLVDRALGVAAAALDRKSLAGRHLDAAVASARQFGLRPEYALASAERIRIEGQPLDQAIQRVRSLGLEGEARRLSALIEEPLEASRPPYPDNLTGREVEVLRLLAAGMTNREIGKRLGISGKTVTNHVTHILTKADLENRAAAAAFAVRHNLAG